MRQIVEAHIITSSDIRQRKEQWQAGDGVPPTGFEFVPDGGLRLAPAITTLVSSATGASQITDLDRTSPYSTAVISWGGTHAEGIEIQRVAVRLHPKRTGAAKDVVWWRCELLALATVYEGAEFRYVPLAAPNTIQATGEAEGEVTFDYSESPVRPQPKSVRLELDWQLAQQGASNPAPDFALRMPHTLVVIYALKADGSSAAANTAWMVDNTISTFGTGNVVRGRSFRDDLSLIPGTWLDNGVLGVPRIAISTGEFTAATITFSGAGNKLNLGAVPTGPVILHASYDAPPGTSVTTEIRDDADAAWVPFTDGQSFTDLSLVATTTRKVRATLTPNALETLTPTLRGLGMEEKIVQDGSDVWEVTSARWGIDPVTLRGEITEAQIVCLKDGRTDYHATIEDILAEHDLDTITMRYYIEDLERGMWVHIDDFKIEDYEGRGGDIILYCLGPTHLIRADLPKYNEAGAAAEIPDSVLDNTGAWTDQVGGTTSLHLFIDETEPDLTDYVRSALSPSSDPITFRLSNVSDPGRDTGHFLNVWVAKSASSGEVIDLLLQVRQGYTNEGSQGTLIMEYTLTPLPDEPTPFSIALTETQAAGITDYTDLSVRCVANASGGGATRRAQIYWMRLQVVGTQDPVVYDNEQADVIYAALLSEAEVPARLIGPGIVETDLLSKTITQSDAWRELNALTSIFGASIVSSSGRIKAAYCHDRRAPVQHFALSDIEQVQVTPGFRQRVPVYRVGWNWNEAEDRFRDVEQWISVPALTKLGTSRIDAVATFDAEASKYIYSKPLATRIAKRDGESRGTGMIYARWRSIYPCPEREVGDVVTVVTNRFIAKDPHSGRNLRGVLALLVVLMEVGDPWITEFGGQAMSYADIFGDVQATAVEPTPPTSATPERVKLYNFDAVETIPNNTATVVPFDLAQFDVGGLFVTVGRITIPVGSNAGQWKFAAQLQWSSFSTAGIRMAEIVMNGTSSIGHVRQTATSAGETTQQVVAVVNDPAVGDYFEVVVTQTSGADLDILGSVSTKTWFHAQRS